MSDDLTNCMSDPKIKKKEEHKAEEVKGAQ